MQKLYDTITLGFESTQLPSFANPMQDSAASTSSTTPNTTYSQPVRLICIALFVVVALVLRFAPLPENFGCFGALSLLCGLMLTGPWRWVIPVVSLFAADCLGHWLGTPGMHFYHGPSMLLNYVAMVAITAVGWSLSRWANRDATRDWTPWAAVLVGAIGGSIVFFLISNFAAWLDPMMGYSASLSGLLHCYQMGLPFFRPTLTSDVIFGVGFFAAYQALAGVLSSAKVWSRS